MTRSQIKNLNSGSEISKREWPSKVRKFDFEKVGEIQKNIRKRLRKNYKMEYSNNSRRKIIDH
jgi:hypothetical protein